MPDDGKSPNLVEQWITKLKNNPVIATFCILTIVATGVAGFVDSINKLMAHFSGDKNGSGTVTTVEPTVSRPLNPRVHFVEEFKLVERGPVFVSKYGISVKVKRVVKYEGGKLVADVAASASGPAEYFSEREKGEQFPVFKQGCNSVLVTINDIKLTWPGEVIGVVSGECES